MANNVSSYTANLAAFLAMERMDATIETAEDLVILHNLVLSSEKYINLMRK